MYRKLTPDAWRSATRSNSRSISRRLELGGGLVQDHESRTQAQGTGDLDELALPDGELGCRLVDFDLDAPFLEQRLRLRAGAPSS